MFAIPLVAGEVDPAWPREPLPPEKSEELLAWTGVGFVRSYRYFATARRTADRSQRMQATYRRAEPKTGRNDPCPCGSGQKFKRCCGTDSLPVH